MSRPRRASVLLFTTLLVSCHEPPAEELATTESVAVEVEPAKTATISAVITATGTADPAPGADWTIVAPGPARIAEMPKAEGDRVRAGDLLVRFDTPGLRSDAAMKSADAAQAEATLENARQNHERLARLLEKGIAARKDVEDAHKQLLSAQAVMRAATAVATDARELSGRSEVRATFAGVVAKRSHNPGDMVDAAASDPVLRVIDPERMQVTVAIPVADLARIVVGRAARVKTPGTEAGGWDQKVLSLPAAVDTATGTATVRVSAPSGLAAGMPVQVEIVAEEHEGAVVVPAAAVVKADDKATAFVVGADGKAHRRELTLGIETLEQIEIEKGVTAGEQVVVKGQDGLPDGASVTTESAEP